MKRVKVMLIAIAVMAMAAGTLAFKARYLQSFCTTTALRDAQGNFTCALVGMPTRTCNVPVSSRIVNNPAITPVCTTLFTATEPGGDPTCVNPINCSTTRLAIE